ncbi:MAG: hypothetical protein R2795_25585 [Saprospiraceae bacterium]
MEWASFAALLGTVLKPLWEKTASKATEDLKGKDIRAAFKRIFIKADKEEEFKEIEPKASLEDKDTTFMMNILNNNELVPIGEKEEILYEALNLVDQNRLKLVQGRLEAIQEAKERMDLLSRQANRGGMLADDSLTKLENLELIYTEHVKKVVQLLLER